VKLIFTKIGSISALAFSNWFLFLRHQITWGISSQSN